MVKTNEVYLDTSEKRRYQIQSYPTVQRCFPLED